MKVILLKNDSKLGSMGSIKTVSDGFARNFLIPNGVALPANKKNVALVAEMKTSKGKTIKDAAKSQTAVVKQLKATTLSFKSKANDTGAFFAKITKDSIAKALQDQGLSIKSKKVHLESAISKAGTYNVEVMAPTGEKVSITVEAKNI